VAFHELDWDGVRSIPSFPTYDRCCRLCSEAIGSSAEIHMGGKLFSTFVDAALAAPTLLLEAVAGVEEPMRIKADLAGSLAAKIEALGLASAADLDPGRTVQANARRSAGEQQLRDRKPPVRPLDARREQRQRSRARVEQAAKLDSYCPGWR